MSEYNHDPKDRVWYACYGSNLSEERFGYYIFGGYFAAQDRDYKGCNDKTPWSASEIKTFKGSIYFGNDSPKWPRTRTRPRARAARPDGPRAHGGKGTAGGRRGAEGRAGRAPANTTAKGGKRARAAGTRRERHRRGKAGGGGPRRQV